MRTRKEDKQIFRTVRVKGTFPRSLRFTEKPDLLFPLTFNLSFMQQVKRVRPRTANGETNRHVGEKDLEQTLLHAQSCSSLTYIPTSHSETLWHLFCLQLASLATKKKGANRCFWHEKASRPPLPQPWLPPAWVFRVQAAPISYSLYNFQAVFKVFTQAFSSNLKKSSAIAVD